MIFQLFEIGVSRLAPVILLATFALSACTSEDQLRPEILRPVKVETVSLQPPAGLQVIGTVRTQKRAELSFEVGGVLDQLFVRAGQEVRKGAVLAQLDRQPAELKLIQAKARLGAQKALVIQTRQLLESNRRLLEDGSAPRKDFEQAEAGYQLALAARDSEDAAVKQAQREYALTRLTAPFDGRVVSYAYEPHTQVSPGQSVIRMVSTGQQNVVAEIPVDQAKRLAVGIEALGVDGRQSGAALKLRMHSISPEAKGGVIQEAEFEILAQQTRLVEGTTLSIQLAAGDTSVVTLPQQAFRGSPEEDGAEVFVYEPETGQVKRREVELAGIEGSRLIVRAGLAQGEQVVVAGAAFLTDSQVVTLFKPIISSGAE